MDKMASKFVARKQSSLHSAQDDGSWKPSQRCQPTASCTNHPCSHRYEAKTATGYFLRWRSSTSALLTLFRLDPIAIVTICTTMISIFQLFPSSGEKATVDATRQDSYLSSPVVKPRSIITPVKPATEELRVEQVPVSSFVTPKPVKAVEEHKEEKEEKTGTKGDADADDEPIAEYPPGYFVPADGETTKTNKDDNKVTDDKKQVKWAHEDQAFVFLLTNDQPMHLIWALEGSLRNVNSTRRRIVLATPKVSDGVKDTLRKLQMEVRDIEQPHHKNFKTQFSHWADTLAKLFIFDLPGIKQFIYLDADTMVNKNVDYLFEKDTNKMVYAMRDVIDCVNGNPHMNAGLLVARPNATLKAELFNLLEDENFFKDRKGDQEMLDVYLQKQYVQYPTFRSSMSF